MPWNRLDMLWCLVWHRYHHVVTRYEGGDFFHHCTKCAPQMGEKG